MRAASLLLVMGMVGCGGSPPRPTGAAPSAPATAPALPAPGRFSTEGLGEYGATRGFAPNAAERRVQAALRRLLPAPPALDCFAREYAARFGADGVDPDPGTALALAHHCGLWALPARITPVTAASATRLEANLRAVAAAAGADAHTVTGLGVVEHPDGRVSAVLAAPPADVDLDPFPRRWAPGARVSLTGRTSGDPGDLVLLFGRRGELPAERPVSQTPTGRFTVDVDLPPDAGAGPLDVMLLRREGRFLRALAHLELYAAPPTTGAPPLVGPAVAPRQGADVAEALAAAVNQRRARAGLGALTLAPHLGAPLDAWLQHAATGPNPPAPVGLQDDRGWPYLDLRYTLTSGRTPTQAIDLLADSPLGQLALMNPTDGHVAFGASAFAGRDGLDVVVATLRRFEPVASGAGRARVLARVNAVRAAAGASPLRPDAALDALARSLADDLLAGRVPWPDAVQAAMERAAGSGRIAGAYAAGAFTVAALDDATDADLLPAAPPGARYVGVGVAGGRLPGRSTARHIVVLLVAEALQPDAWLIDRLPRGE